MLAISNMVDFTLVEGLDATSPALANAAISVVKMGLDISLGVTPFSREDTKAIIIGGANEVKSEVRNEDKDMLQREWMISPCVSPNEVLSSCRQVTLAAMGALVTLYSSIEERSSSSSSSGSSVYVSLLTAPGESHTCMHECMNGRESMNA